MKTNICRSVRHDCWNRRDSYGEICVGCGCCSRDKETRYKSRLAVSKEHLKEELSNKDFSDDPYWRDIEKKNVQANIKYITRRIRYYDKKLKELRST